MAAKTEKDWSERHSKLSLIIGAVGLVLAIVAGGYGLLRDRQASALSEQIASIEAEMLELQRGASSFDAKLSAGDLERVLFDRIRDSQGV